MISGVKGAAAKHLHQRHDEAAVRAETGRLLVSNFGQFNSHFSNS